MGQEMSLCSPLDQCNPFTNTPKNTENKTNTSTTNFSHEELSDEQSDSDSTDDIDTADQCQSVKQIIFALYYYESLSSDNKHMKNEQFMKYISNTYTDNSLLDDYIHIITKHNNNFDDIFEIMHTQYQFTRCNIADCSYSTRHYANNINDKNTSKFTGLEETNISFYQQILDSIHFCVMHLYDTGMRVKEDTFNDIAAIKTQHEYSDDIFANICGTVKRKQQILRKMSGYEDRFNNNKFNITMNNNLNHKRKIDGINDEVTFIDAVVQQIISNQNISKKAICNMQQFISKEEYDSDCIIHDVNYNSHNNNGENSNIKQHLNDTNQYQLIQTSIKRIQLENEDHDTMFSIGFRFYYWNFYSKVSDEQLENNRATKGPNKNNHHGYTMNELFVVAKYKDIKHEILNNNIHTLNIDEFKSVTNKAEKYINTQHAKKIIYYGNDDLHYEIPDYSLISFFHLVSICLYCDWSNLCTAFSSTFRKNKSFEPIESVKRRNSEFGNWAKRLRETVEYFGKSGSSYKNPLCGPFYCGMSFIMNMPEFNIRLCGAVSTSKQLSVATNFAGNRGIIIQLNNNGSHIDKWSLKAFGCSWISRYSEEDEFLFCGGAYKIKIESVRNMYTKQNFYLFFKALFLFDCMIDGSDMEMNDDINNMSDSDYIILNRLLKYKCGTVLMSKIKMDKYVIDTFETFTNNKNELILNLHYINQYFKPLKEFILYGNDNNMFKKEIFQLFPNIKNIIIDSAYWDPINCRYSQYKFDLLSMFEIIKTSLFKRNGVKLTVTAIHKYKCDASTEWVNKSVERSWIFNAVTTKLLNEFKRNKFNITLLQTCFETDRGEYVWKEDKLIIRYNGGV